MADEQQQRRERLRAITAQVLGLTVEEIVDDSTLEQDMAADSLDRVELAIAIEEEWNLELPDDEPKGWATFADMAASLEKHRPAG